MKDAREQLQANDSVDDDDEQHEERNVEQRDHGFEDRVQYDLET